MARLPHLVPPPFAPSGDVRSEILGRARALRLAEELRRTTQRAAGQRELWGAACTYCKGRGCQTCERCQGQGFQVRGRERRYCPPILRCPSCNGSGRARGSSLHQELGRVHSAVAAYLKEIIDGGAKQLKSLPRRWHDLTALDTHGYVPDPGFGRDIRKALETMPFDPERLTDAEEAGLRSAWSRADWNARHDFVRTAILESLAFQERVRYLVFEGSPSITAGPKTVEVVDPRILEIIPQDFVGRWVGVEVTRAALLVDRPAIDIPFQGILDVEEIDPRVLAVYLLAPRDRRALDAAVQTGLAGFLRPYLRTYPKELHAAWERVRPGQRAILVGRILPHPTGSPAHVFEVWSVE